MKAFKKNRKQSGISRAEALQSTPAKTLQVNESRLETGDVLLSYSATVRPWFSGLIKRFGGPASGTIHKKLQLDALGTEVWDLIDGKRTVRKMIQEFTEKHQLHPREAEVAVTRFLRELGSRGLVGMR